MKGRYFLLACLLVAILFGSGDVAANFPEDDGSSGHESHPLPPEGPSLTNGVYLPVIHRQEEFVPRVNAPYFDGDVRFSETAIFWFGQVNPTDNYADVRVGYNDSELYVHVAVFDRLLWYDDTSPIPDELTAWDTASLYLDLDGNTGEAPDTNSFRFIGQLNWWETRQDWQAGYRGDGSGWISDPITFTTTSGWRGNAPNDDIEDRGWSLTYHIPFTSLDLPGPPVQGTTWGLGVELHDRDDAAGTPITDKVWPIDMLPERPATWGQLPFGLPTYTPPSTDVGGMVTIRHDLEGAVVTDAHVGGHTVCGQDYWPDFFDGWGNANYAGYTQFNIQNQSDVADWPCFSKYYLTFPLDAVPSDKVIITATLGLHLFGNSGQGWEPPPQPSLIQVLTINETWNENYLTWNNAPYALENVSQTWVYPLDEYPGEPGIPYEWDVSRAVADAYDQGGSLRLALYSTDSAIHSGKYFWSSDTDEWNAEGRPTLEVVWGNP